MSQPEIITFLGKGGVGKTVLAALTGKIFMEKGKRVLFVDADPTMGLTTALELTGVKTMGQAREEIIRRAWIATSFQEKAKMAEMIDYMLLEALFEGPDFSILTMGQTDTLGCFCPVNTLLRQTIGAIASQYEVVVIDAEAGIEQLSRQVVESVHYPIVVADNSVRGVKTAITVRDTILKVPTMSPLRLGMLFNRVDQVNSSLIEMAENACLEVYGWISHDPQIADIDADGKCLVEHVGNTGAIRQLQEVFARLMLKD
ncbi:MAG: AAA family ATPase [Ignavibacteriales bacterium]